MFDSIGIVVFVVVAILLLAKVGYGLYGYFILEWSFAEAFWGSGGDGDGSADGGD